MVKLCFLLYHVSPPRQHSAANRFPADMGARRAKKPAAGAFCVRTPACRAGYRGALFRAGALRKGPKENEGERKPGRTAMRDGPGALL